MPRFPGADRMGRKIEIQVLGHPTIGGTFDRDSVPSIDIGRSGACAVVLDDPLIAPKHCRLEFDADRVVLHNLDQEIGVICDGVYVENETTLAGEHELDLGGVQLVVRVVEAAPTGGADASAEPDPAEPVPEEPPGQEDAAPVSDTTVPTTEHRSAVTRPAPPTETPDEPEAIAEPPVDDPDAHTGSEPAAPPEPPMPPEPV
ncbi:MAG TPA: FHA domain-containing protein, partial [Phycisphaerales bacterium]|nr:FHA domain-containing protein [Phycisphaerales bacterium]